MGRTDQIAAVFLRSCCRTSWTPIIVVGLGFALLAADTAADDYIVRDRDGRRIGTVDRIDRDRVILHARDGRRLGTLTPTPGGDLVVHDRLGRWLGTLALQTAGAAIQRDRLGARAGRGTPR